MMEDSESRVRSPRTELLSAIGSPGGKIGSALSFEPLLARSREPLRIARDDVGK